MPHDHAPTSPGRRRVPADAARAVINASVVVVAACLLVLIFQLPTAELLAAFERWAREFGPAAAGLFVLAYIAVTLALGPTWPLMIAAGATFGVVGGAAVSMVGAAIGSAAAFIIARHVAREPVERLARRNRHFAAIDAAVAEGGWRLVALLRVSPVTPFSLQSYLYGLTRIGFWPCVLTTAVAMLPEFVAYAYLGHAMRSRGAAVLGQSAWSWALLAGGITATVAALAYVGRLTRRKLRERGIDDSVPRTEPTPMPHAPPNRSRPRLALASAALAAAAVGATFVALADAPALGRWAAGVFGPPAFAGSEVFPDRAAPGGPRVDHAAFDRVMKRIVTPDGYVDYEALRADPADLDAYLGQLQRLDFDALARDEKLATLVNAYNAFTLRLILDHWPVASIKDIPEAQRWKADLWRLGAHTLSLDAIEHEWLRKKFVEPRIHFAIVCASVGCPPLRNEAFVADRIDAQLEDQARRVHGTAPGGDGEATRWFRYDPATDTLQLTKLYQWFAGDFDAVAGSAPAFAARYAPELKAALDADRVPEVEWLEYDWSLNSPR